MACLLFSDDILAIGTPDDPPKTRRTGVPAGGLCGFGIPGDGTFRLADYSDIKIKVLYEGFSHGYTVYLSS
jgi:hypothetical protein